MNILGFEDIVQAYPLFFEFTDENGNLISWGGKAKVGSTITRTKGVAYANLLESLYTVTNNYWKGIFYKLMLYSKTIDMLSINALKNLFALDILIDINHPIFKK